MENLDKIIDWLYAREDLINKCESFKLEVNCSGKSLKKSFTEFDNSVSDDEMSSKPYNSLDKL